MVCWCDIVFLFRKFLRLIFIGFVFGLNIFIIVILFRGNFDWGIFGCLVIKCVGDVVVDKEGVGIVEVDFNFGLVGVMGMILGVVIGGFGLMIVEVIFFNFVLYVL